MYKLEELEKRIFTENKDKWLEAGSKDYLLKEKINVRNVKNAIILPLKKIDSTTYNGKYVGGVCDENFNFLGGLIRNKDRFINYSCCDSYEVSKEEITYYDEKVIFGGVIISTFGHLILESLSRLWYVVENKPKCKVAFVVINDNYKSYFDNFFKLLDIDLKKVIYIKKPSKFKEVIIPDETIYAWSNYKEKYHVIYDKICKNIKAKKDKKIYLTRSKFEKQDCFNESYFEDFYQKRGFKIIAPEQYSIEEQIAYIKGADYVVCTLGTLSHLLLFAKPKTKLVILNRAEINPLIPQLIINQAKDLDYYIIDVSFNLLPVNHNHGCFLLGPTKYWKEYLHVINESYQQEEIDMNLKDFAYDYLVKWCETFQIKKRWDYSLTTFDNFDVLNFLSTSLLDKPLRRKDYKNSYKDKEKNYKKEIAQIKEEKEHLEIENRKLKSESEKLKKKVKNITSSKSWKITAPLRKIAKVIRKTYKKRERVERGGE